MQKTPQNYQNKLCCRILLQGMLNSCNATSDYFSKPLFSCRWFAYQTHTIQMYISMMSSNLSYIIPLYDLLLTIGENPFSDRQKQDLLYESYKVFYNNLVFREWYFLIKKSKVNDIKKSVASFYLSFFQRSSLLASGLWFLAFSNLCTLITCCPLMSAYYSIFVVLMLLKSRCFLLSLLSHSH